MSIEGHRDEHPVGGFSLFDESAKAPPRLRQGSVKQPWWYRENFVT